ncbi:uncharacterized protein K452DRAFT_9452 [Aplosporella prunicola CBS 121167]|uniref:Uncharacterized protein n=1 Tax=Aplosporella prunicola CBS 121167 TaxID=1176127 RepID=A0A6A6BHA3_9PEZI|nr:uncharacterized protein K452DRAFT_9452 [Aplosporella prunicola CBS 121167]KAF2142705.1 hypothetical protein K452DRAFT_9452 [Aplosporella prunicola CBS 121167]
MGRDHFLGENNSSAWHGTRISMGFNNSAARGVLEAGPKFCIPLAFFPLAFPLAFFTGIFSISFICLVSSSFAFSCARVLSFFCEFCHCSRTIAHLLDSPFSTSLGRRLFKVWETRHGSHFSSAANHCLDDTPDGIQVQSLGMGRRRRGCRRRGHGSIPSAPQSQ